MCNENSMTKMNGNDNKYLLVLLLQHSFVCCGTRRNWVPCTAESGKLYTKFTPQSLFVISLVNLQQYLYAHLSIPATLWLLMLWGVSWQDDEIFDNSDAGGVSIWTFDEQRCWRLYGVNVFSNLPSSPMQFGRNSDFKPFLLWILSYKMLVRMMERVKRWTNTLTDNFIVRHANRMQDISWSIWSTPVS